MPCLIMLKFVVRGLVFKVHRLLMPRVVGGFGVAVCRVFGLPDRRSDADDTDAAVLASPTQ